MFAYLHGFHSSQNCYVKSKGSYHEFDNKRFKSVE